MDWFRATSRFEPARHRDVRKGGAHRFVASQGSAARATTTACRSHETLPHAGNLDVCGGLG